MTPVVRSAMWLVGTGLVLGIVYLSYLAVTIIDDNVVEGSAYGFEIGRGKRESFNDAIAALASADILIREGRGEEAGARIGQRVQFNLMPGSLSVIEDQDVWEFYFR